MNLYLRYFDKETLVTSLDEGIDFLYSIPEIGMNPSMEADVREYVNSDVLYPKRYKVRQRSYFIIIKTTAATMRDFKDKKALRPSPTPQQKKVDEHATMTELPEEEQQAAPVTDPLTAKRPGWYEGELDFKRVVQTPHNGKFEYVDAHFMARCKADSPIDCYNRIVGHLRERVDRRSQFPSAKGRNYKYTYLGKWK